LESGLGPEERGGLFPAGVAGLRRSHQRGDSGLFRSRPPKGVSESPRKAFATCSVLFFLLSTGGRITRTCKLGPHHGLQRRLGETGEGRAFLRTRGTGGFHAVILVRLTRRSRAGLVCFALNGGPPGERRLFE
jgi:hypothetical protein